MYYRLSKGYSVVMETESLEQIRKYCRIKKNLDVIGDVRAELVKKDPDYSLECVKISEASEQAIRDWEERGGVISFRTDSETRDGSVTVYNLSVMEFRELFRNQKLFSDMAEFARYICQTSLYAAGLGKPRMLQMMRQHISREHLLRDTYLKKETDVMSGE